MAQEPDPLKREAHPPGGSQGGAERSVVQLLADTTPDNQVKALTALADWSKWLITIETTIITILISTKSISGTGGLFYLSVASIMCSIILATILMGQIPYAIQSVHKGQQRDDILTYDDIRWFPKLKLATIAFAQHAAAILGAVLVVAHFLTQTPPAPTP